LIIVAFFDRGDRLTVVAFAAWLMMCLTVFLLATQIKTDRMTASMRDRLMPIVAETERFSIRRISSLNSKSKISDVSGARCSSER
jgi:hypothetical protein